jgi:ribosomal protein L9
MTNNREQTRHEIEKMKDSIKKNMSKLGHDFGSQTKATLAESLRNMLSMFEQMI